MLSVVVAERPEALLDELAASLATPLEDPFCPELVCVSSLGLANWTRQQLSKKLGTAAANEGGATGSNQDGIVANIQMPGPAAIRSRVLRSYRTARGAAAEVNPWGRRELVWSVLKVLGDASGVTSSIPGLPATASGVAASSEIAALFHGYNCHRPQMVLDWVKGLDLGPDGRELEPEQTWQPELFRRVRSAIGLSHGMPASPPEQLVEAIEQLKAGADLAVEPDFYIPPRLFVLAQTSLPADIGPLLEALGIKREVKLFVLTPSPSMVLKLAAEVYEDPHGEEIPLRPTWAFPRSDLQSPEADHPLLRTWGGLHTDTALLLTRAGMAPEVLRPEAGRPEPQTLLEAVQETISGDDPGPLAGQSPVADGTIQVHGASGRTRQVEILRDQILDLLRARPELSEDQIVVVCPRIDLYAPIIAGVWGAPAAHGAKPEPEVVPALRYSLVDQMAGSLNPVLAAVDAMLDLIGRRFTVSEVTSFLRLEPVRRKFGLGEDEFDLVERLRSRAHVRWGLNGAHRAPWGITPDYEKNSWRWGIDQLMMGVALGDDLRDAKLPGQKTGPDNGSMMATRLAPGGVPPLFVREGDMSASGNLAGGLRALYEVQQLLDDGGHRPVAEWSQLLREATDLTCSPEPLRGWQREALDNLLDGLVNSSVDPDGDPSAVPIDFGEFRMLLEPIISGQRSRGTLTYGAIQVASPGAIAAVPHEVVCVLGLDADSMLPTTRSLDDLVAASDWIGDSDGRIRARADLLSAVMSARSNLVITHTSKDVNNNRDVPAAVVLEEFLETVAGVLQIPVEALKNPDAGVYVRHPRQAFDPVNFNAGDGSRPVSYDPSALKGAVALGERNGTVTAQARAGAQRIFLDHRVGEPPTGSGVIELDDLISFFSRPVETFFRSTLGVTIPKQLEASDEELPTTLTGLEASHVGQMLLDAGLRGELQPGFTGLAEAEDEFREAVLGDALRVFNARGQLPPPALSRTQLHPLGIEVAEILALADQLGIRTTERLAHAVDVRLSSGYRVVGSVDCMESDSGIGPVDVRFSRMSARLRLRNLIGLVAVAATDPASEWTGVLIARGYSTGKPAEVVVTAPRGSTLESRRKVALDCLERLVAQYLDGLRCALPLFPKTSFDLAHDGKWRDKWTSRIGGERDDRYNEFAFGHLEPDELAEVHIEGFTLGSEAERLWTGLDEAICDPSGEEEVK